MLKIGPHISMAKGYEKATLEALEINANTFQFFTRNPRGGKSKKLDLEDIAKCKKLLLENNFAPLLAHSPYTLNLASSKEEARTFAGEIFRSDLDLLKHLPCNLYNFHPGSPTTDSKEIGLERIVVALNENIKEDDDVFILLETMSGKGSELGVTFAELKYIIDNVTLKEKIGVCFDTCHLFSAGYDIVNNLEGVLEEFDKLVGMEKLKAVHLNDSKNDFDTRKDIHAKIGEGFIGLKPLVNFINHKSLKDLPFFLETPNEKEGYKKEIETLRNLYDK